jgi:4-amino-4-deoxy-L-arabinose transferase-like glycosyltransferase
MFTAVLASASLRLHGAAFVLSVYVSAWVEVVLLAEAASPARTIGRVSYGLGEAALLGVVAFVWFARGRPRPRLPRLGRSDVSQHPVIALLSVVVLAAFLYQAFISLAVPPNNVDALTYHLPRVAAWLHRGAVGYFPANTARDNAFPIVAELGVLYTFVFSARDTFAALPQLIAEVAVLVAIYGSSRRLGFSTAGALFAALVTATLSEFALESTTAQNDLVVASFISTAVFFVLSRERSEVRVAAVAVALAVGTKLTAIFALPIVAALALVVLPRRRLTDFAVCSLVAFALVGSWTYADNLKNTGHLLGIVPEDAPYTPSITPGSTFSTVAHIYYRFVDFSGLPVSAYAGNVVGGAGNWLFAHVRIEPPSNPTSFNFLPNNLANEDFSYFGVLGALLVIPLSFGFLASGLLSRRWRNPRFVVAASLPVYITTVALANVYNPWLGRFMLIPVALTMPLAGWFYDKRLNAAAAAVAAIGAITLVYTHAHNTYEPTGLTSSRPAVWTMPRLEAQTLAIAPGFAPTIRAIDRDVPQDASIGTDLTTGDITYPLYGARLSRVLVTLPRRDTLTAATQQHINWVIVAKDRPITRLRGWTVTTLENGWRLAGREHNQRLSSTEAESIAPATSGTRSGRVPRTTPHSLRADDVRTLQLRGTPSRFGGRALRHQIAKPSS